MYARGGVGGLQVANAPFLPTGYRCTVLGSADGIVYKKSAPAVRGRGLLFMVLMCQSKMCLRREKMRLLSSSVGLMLGASFIALNVFSWSGVSFSGI